MKSKISKTNQNPEKFRESDRNGSAKITEIQKEHKASQFSRRNFLGKGTATLIGLGIASKSNILGSEIDLPEVISTPSGKGSLSAPTLTEGPGNNFESISIHAGEDSGCSAYPVYQGSNNNGIYSRGSNPVIDSVEVKIMKLDGAEKAIATACGMAAISTTLLSLLKPGMRIIYHRVTYSGTGDLMGKLRRLNIVCDAIDMTDPQNLRNSIAKGKTDVVFFEVHTNPLVEVIDVKTCIEIAHNAGSLAVVDNTWLSPYLIQPIALGADIVLHSATKYMMGHGNGLAGIVCGNKNIMKEVESIRGIFGTILSPMNASLLHQGIKTLPIRMECHCNNAMKIAEFLAGHPKVARVHYPGLTSDPGHNVAKKQVRGFGGMVGIETKGELKLWGKCKFIRPWWSLGDVETLMAPYIYKDNVLNPYIRMSIGLENPDDIIEDLKQAFNNV